jgi:hypothetical protein
MRSQGMGYFHAAPMGAGDLMIRQQTWQKMINSS